MTLEGLNLTFLLWFIWVSLHKWTEPFSSEMFSTTIFCLDEWMKGRKEGGEGRKQLGGWDGLLEERRKSFKKYLLSINSSYVIIIIHFIYIAPFKKVLDKLKIKNWREQGNNQKQFSASMSKEQEYEIKKDGGERTAEEQETTRGWNERTGRERKEMEEEKKEPKAFLRPYLYII